MIPGSMNSGDERPEPEDDTFNHHNIWKGASAITYLIDEGNVGDANDCFIRVFIEVESTLFQPLKIRWLFDVKTTLKKKQKQKKKLKTRSRSMHKIFT